MKETAEESAVLKQRFKHEPLSPELGDEARKHPQEAEEAVWEVDAGYDTCAPGSYVAYSLRENRSE